MCSFRVMMYFLTVESSGSADSVSRPTCNFGIRKATAQKERFLSFLEFQWGNLKIPERQAHAKKMTRTALLVQGWKRKGV